MLSATSPFVGPTPLLLNTTTGRDFANAFTSAGSHESIVPVKCWRNTNGVPECGPKVRYENLMPFASRYFVGAVSNFSAAESEPDSTTENVVAINNNDFK